MSRHTEILDIVNSFLQSLYTSSVEVTWGHPDLTTYNVGVQVSVSDLGYAEQDRGDYILHVYSQDKDLVPDAVEQVIAGFVDVLDEGYVEPEHVTYYYDGYADRHVAIIQMWRT